jgi:hypothetical protein
VPESSAARLRWTDLAVAIDEIAEENLRVFLSRVLERVGRHETTSGGGQ